MERGWSICCSSAEQKVPRRCVVRVVGVRISVGRYRSRSCCSRCSRRSGIRRGGGGGAQLESSRRVPERVHCRRRVDGGRGTHAAAVVVVVVVVVLRLGETLLQRLVLLLLLVLVLILTLSHPLAFFSLPRRHHTHLSGCTVMRAFIRHSHFGRPAGRGFEKTAGFSGGSLLLFRGEYVQYVSLCRMHFSSSDGQRRHHRMGPLSSPPM